MKRIIRSFGHAVRGLLHCIQKEKNFQIQLGCGCIAISAGIFFHLTGMEWCIVLLCITMVLSMEMLNTAIEHICNIIQKEYHPAIGILKDISAGAVLVSACSTLICSGLIFIPKILLFISSIKAK
jgi:diacylglycerol kinase